MAFYVEDENTIDPSHRPSLASDLEELTSNMEACPLAESRRRRRGKSKATELEDENEDKYMSKEKKRIKKVST